MKENKRIFQLTASLASKLLGCHNKKDDKRILKWLSEKESNSNLYDRLSNAEYRLSLRKKMDSYNSKEAWEKIEYRLLKEHDRRINITRYYKYAALVLLFLTIGLSTNYLINDTDLFVKEIPINLLSSKATLILSNGEIIDLTNDTSYVGKNFNITVDDGKETVIYKERSSDNKQKQGLFNIIKTDIGKDYKIILSEGTVAHLNSGSTLKFPANFSGDVREVEAYGEILFDVAKDKTKPFIVKTNNVKIEVLGTIFNLNSYEDNGSVVTTLISGSLRVVAGENSVLISPDQQAVYDKETTYIAVKNVDSKIYSSWAEGEILFKDEQLINIVKSLNRWYDFDYSFKDQEVKQVRLGMSLDREENFEKIYETLKNSNLFLLEKRGKTLIFSSKPQKDN